MDNAAPENNQSESKVCVIRDAWHKVKELRGPLWGAMGVFLLIAVGCSCIVSHAALASGMLPPIHELWSFLTNVGTQPGNSVLYASGPVLISLAVLCSLACAALLWAIFELFVLLPARMGIRLIPLRVIANRAASMTQMFALFSWHYIWRFMVLQFLIALIVGTPFIVASVLCVMPQMYLLPYYVHILLYTLSGLLYLLAFYFFIAYLFAKLLIIDRNMRPWKAMELSRMIVGKHFFCILGALIWCVIVLIIGVGLLFIGIIWAIPYTLNVIACIYHKYFGIEGRDPVTLSELR